MGASVSRRSPQVSGSGSSIFLPGAVPRAELDDYLAPWTWQACRRAWIGVGAFRYTTKISEYLAAGLPIVTGEIPPGLRPRRRVHVAPAGGRALGGAIPELHSPSSWPRSRARRSSRAGGPHPITRALFDADRQRRQVDARVRPRCARARALQAGNA